MQKIEFAQVRDFGALLNATFEFIKQNYKILFKSIIFIAGPFILLAGIFGGIYQSTMFSFDLEPEVQEFAIPFLLDMLFMVLAYLAIGVVAYSFILLYLEKPVEEIDVDDIWQKGKSIIWILIITGILYTLLVALGFVLIIIPGIYLLVMLSPIYMIRLIEGKSFTEAVSRSANLISGKWWFTFGFLIVLGIIQGFLGFVFYIPMYIITFISMFAGMDGSSPGAVSEITLIIGSIISSFGIIFYVISIIGISFHYFNLVEQKDAPGLMKKIEELEQ